MLKKLLLIIISVAYTCLFSKQLHAQKLNVITVNTYNTKQTASPQQLDYFGQAINSPDGKKEFILPSAFCTQNEYDQTIAFLLPDQKCFFWVDNGTAKGYFQEGGNTQKYSYMWYVEDCYNRKLQPVSWGIYLAANDYGGFGIELATNPIETTKGFALGLKKMATLQFDFNKTWQRVLNADATDISYVAATIALTYLSCPKATGSIAAEDAPKFRAMLEISSAKTYPLKLTWPQILELFRKAKAFEIAINKHLKILFPESQGYTVLEQIYLKVDGVVSIADNIIYNVKTDKFFLNETKYGITDALSKNQKIIEEAVKAGKELEIRTLNDIQELSGRVIRVQGNKISISKILRSHSVDGTITNNTVKTIWHE